jgi:hypothetical protein
MARTRDASNAWAAGSRGAEVERLEQELAKTRAGERRARLEAEETRERFERLLDASRRFTRTLSDRRRQQQTSRRNLAALNAVEGVLAEADILETVGLEDVATRVLRTLGENLGWQVAVFGVAGEETLRCIEVWHRPDAAPTVSRRRAAGRASCVVRACLVAPGQRTDPCGPEIRHEMRGSSRRPFRRSAS